MGWLTDLLKEYPALAVAKERLSLIEDKLQIAEEENKKLLKENEVLKAVALRVESQNKFIEFTGVLWKESNGAVETLAYCPECKLAMSAFPPGENEMLLCSKCNFIAPFTPNEVKTLASELEINLLTA